MIRVLVDGRVDGHDGIGRYTRCLAAALRAHTDPGFRIEVLPPADTPRYSRAEGLELLHAARQSAADVIHVLDYRVPLESTRIPVVATIYDVLRLAVPEYCYRDDGFATRFGWDGLAELRTVTAVLRTMTREPPGAVRHPQSLHEEFYGRMLMLACARARHIVTPTRTVSAQLTDLTGRRSRVRTSPPGVDHLRAGKDQVPALPAAGDRYLLYVGQARPHKGLTALLDAFERSRARHAGVRLVCAGMDFAPGTDGAGVLTAHLGGGAVAAGLVGDDELGALYSRATVLVHLAGHEGFGFTPLEALACGCRVVASDIAVLRETLGPHATFVDPADSRAVARAIDRLLAAPDEPGERERRMRWAGRYRWSRHVGDLMAVYTEAAESASS